jgi:hypothetical protein
MSDASGVSKTSSLVGGSAPPELDAATHKRRPDDPLGRGRLPLPLTTDRVLLRMPSRACLEIVWLGSDGS